MAFSYSKFSENLGLGGLGEFSEKSLSLAKKKFKKSLNDLHKNIFSRKGTKMGPHLF